MRSQKAETRQDTLAENETVLLELDDGSRLVEVDDSESYQDPLSYRVETSFGDEITLAGDIDQDGERRARLWIHLYDLVGGFKKPSRPTTIPLDVVVDGKPAVATYLYSVEEWDSESVADRLDVSRRTVWDYLSEIRRRSDVESV